MTLIKIQIPKSFCGALIALAAVQLLGADPAKLLAERGNIIGTETPAMKAARTPAKLGPILPRQVVEQQRINDALYSLRTGKPAMSFRVGAYSYASGPKYKSNAQKLLAERGNIIGSLSK